MSEPAKSNGVSTSRRFRIASAASYGFAIFLVFLFIGIISTRYDPSSPIAWLIGFIGLALGTRRGFKAGPIETSFVSILIPLIIDYPAVMRAPLSPFVFEVIPAKLIRVSGLTMVFCMVLILGFIVIFTIQKRKIRWDYLLRLNSAALIAAAVFGTLTFTPNVLMKIWIVFILLLPIGLLRWMFSCWILHEAALMAKEEVADTPGPCCGDA